MASARSGKTIRAKVAGKPVTKKTATARKPAVAAKEASTTARSATPAKKARAKAVASRKPAASKAAAKSAPGKSATKAAPGKTATSKPAAKKTASKQAATKRAIAKPTPAKVAARKPGSKSAIAKKSVVKPAAVKTAAKKKVPQGTTRGHQPSASKVAGPKATARKSPRAKAPAEVRKSTFQLEQERHAAQERRELEREQAAAHFLAALESHKRLARQGPTWPGSAAHAGRLASIGGHEFHDHAASPGSTARRSPQAKRGKR